MRSLNARLTRLEQNAAETMLAESTPIRVVLYDPKRGPPELEAGCGGTVVFLPDNSRGRDIE